MIDVEIARESTDELLIALNELLPQLSSSAAPLRLEDLDALVRHPAVTLFVARESGRMCGSLTLVVFPIPTGLRAWVEDVVVDESVRGRGAGVALTQAAVDEARRCGARSLDLTSRPSRQAANALYRKMGFEVRETNVYRYSIDD